MMLCPYTCHPQCPKRCFLLYLRSVIEKSKIRKRGQEIDRQENCKSRVLVICDATSPQEAGSTRTLQRHPIKCGRKYSLIGLLVGC